MDVFLAMAAGMWLAPLVGFALLLAHYWFQGRRENDRG
jgi:hypothetical protein